MERRTEKRLHYRWPLWFAEGFKKPLSQAQMLDISSTGAAFTCEIERNYPACDQQITIHFSVPYFCAINSYDMAHFTRSGVICRADDVNEFSRRIAVKFNEALPFKPGEQIDHNLSCVVEKCTTQVG